MLPMTQAAPLHPLAGKLVEIIKSPLSVLPGAKSYNVVDVSGYMIQLRVADAGDNSADEMIMQINGRSFWVGLQGLLIIECDQAVADDDVQHATPPVKSTRRSRK